MLNECLMDYFIEPESIVNIWRYIFVLNYYIYKAWWLEQFKDDKKLKGVPAIALTKVSTVFDNLKYWDGENFMKKYVMNYKDMHGIEFIKPPEISPNVVREKDMQEIVFDPKAYANRELNEMPSFVEAMKQCTEIEMRNCENQSIVTDEVRKKADQAWKKCMELQFITLPTESVLPRNQEGQWKMRTEKLVEIMKGNERLSKFARKDENALKLEYLTNSTWQEIARQIIDTRNEEKDEKNETNKKGKDMEEGKGKMDQMVEALAKSMRMPQSQTSERHEKMRNLLDYTFNEQHETMRGKSKIKAIDGRESADESVRETMVKEESQRQERIDRENKAIKAVAREEFLRDPLAPDAAILLARIEYIEFLRAKTDDAIQTCRLTMAVTAYIYFLTQLLRERGREGKNWPINYYEEGKIGLCVLLNYHGYYTKGQHKDEQIECSEENLANVKQLLLDNEFFIQETIYQFYMILPNDKTALFGIDFQEQTAKATKSKEYGDFLITKFVYLFGHPRFYMLWAFREEIRLLVGKTEDQMLVFCFQGYFEHAHNVFEKWRYIFAINYFVYREWRDHGQLQINDSPLVVYEKLLLVLELGKYWLGESYLRAFVRPMTIKYSKKPQHELVPPMVRNDAGKWVPLNSDEILRQEAKEIFLYMETYATRELHALPSYLEAMRGCIEQMWQNAKSAEEWKMLKNQAPIWTGCVNDRTEQYDEATQKYTHFEENLREQQNMRAKRLVKILSESNDELLMKLATSNADHLHYLANLTSEKLHEAIEAHQDKTTTPLIDNEVADAVPNDELPKAKKSAKQRRKEKRNRDQDSIENELKNLDQEQMAVEKDEKPESSENPQGTTAAASVEGQSAANTNTVTEPVDSSSGQIVTKGENNFGTNVQKQMELNTTDQQQDVTAEHETRKEDAVLEEDAVKRTNADINAIDQQKKDRQPKDQQINAEHTRPRTEYKHAKKHTRGQHLIWQPKKDQQPKDQHEIDPKRAEHPDDSEHIGPNKNALLIKGYIGEFGKVINLERVCEMAEQYASGKSHSFDAKLEELFAYYFECQEEEEDKIMQIKTFIGIVTLVKIIEEKFLSAQWLIIEKGNFTEKEQISVKGLEKSWLEFKKHYLANSSEGADNLANMKELLEKLYTKFMEVQSLPTEIENKGISSSSPDREHAEGEVKNLPLIKLQFLTFCQTLSIIGANENMKIMMFLLKFKDRLEKGKKFSPQIFERMKILFEDGDSRKYVGKLRYRLKVAIDLRQHINFEINLLEFINKMPETEKGEMQPEKWINPDYFEFTQPEYSSIMAGNAKYNDELKNFLSMKYASTDVLILNRARVIKQIERQIKEWLTEQMEKDGNKFTIYLGGSTMLGTNDQDTDMDITVILPRMPNFDEIVCDPVPMGAPSLPQDVIFSERCPKSLFHNLKANKQNSGVYQVGGPDTTSPLIRLFMLKIQVDLTFVVLPHDTKLWSRINANTDLASHDNPNDILQNIELTESLLNEMCTIKQISEDEKKNDKNNNNNQNQMMNMNMNDHPHGKDIRVMSSFLFQYRLKFVTIKGHRMEAFTNLVQIIKLWAKGKNIYSNVLGYLSGTSLSIMAAKICLLYPTGNLEFLVEKFFHIFGMWEWPKPVLLEQWNERKCGDIDGWQPKEINKPPIYQRMPIIMTQYAEINTLFNVTEMNRMVIQRAFRNANDELKRRRTFPLIEQEEFWPKYLSSKIGYESEYESDDYDSYFLLICSAKDKQNYEAYCGSAKRRIRWDLMEWWEKEKFEDKERKISLKDYLDIYHVFTGYERRGKCQINGVKDDCMAWIVGLKFVENPNVHLTEEERTEFIETFMGKGVIVNLVKITYEKDKKALDLSIHKAFHTASDETKVGTSSSSTQHPVAEVPESKEQLQHQKLLEQLRQLQHLQDLSLQKGLTPQQLKDQLHLSIELQNLLKISQQLLQLKLQNIRQELSSQHLQVQLQQAQQLQHQLQNHLAQFKRLLEHQLGYLHFISQHHELPAQQQKDQLEISEKLRQLQQEQHQLELKQQEMSKELEHHLSLTVVAHGQPHQNANQLVFPNLQGQAYFVQNPPAAQFHLGNPQAQLHPGNSHPFIRPPFPHGPHPSFASIPYTSIIHPPVIRVPSFIHHPIAYPVQMPTQVMFTAHGHGGAPSQSVQPAHGHGQQPQHSQHEPRPAYHPGLHNPQQ